MAFTNPQTVTRHKTGFALLTSGRRHCHNTLNPTVITTDTILKSGKSIHNSRPWIYGNTTQKQTSASNLALSSSGVKLAGGMTIPSKSSSDWQRSVLIFLLWTSLCKGVHKLSSCPSSIRFSVYLAFNRRLRNFQCWPIKVFLLSFLLTGQPLGQVTGEIADTYCNPEDNRQVRLIRPRLVLQSQSLE